MSNDKKEVKVFSELEIWAHKHIIHIALLLILTGLAVSAEKLPSWIKWAVGWIPYALGTPAAWAAAQLGFSPLEQSISAYSTGVQIARILHRIGGLILIAIGVAWFFGEIFRFREWQIWPKKKFTTEIRELIKYYIGKEEVEIHKYNLGQRIWIYSVFIGGILLIATGIILWFRTSFSPTVVAYAHELHSWLAWFAIVGILVHVYLAIGIPEHRPMVRAMFRTGTAPLEYLKKHHRLFVKDLIEKDKTN